MKSLLIFRCLTRLRDWEIQIEWNMHYAFVQVNDETSHARFPAVSRMIHTSLQFRSIKFALVHCPETVRHAGPSICRWLAKGAPHRDPADDFDCALDWWDTIAEGNRDAAES